MKKVIVIVLATMFLLAACGGGTPSETEQAKSFEEIRSALETNLDMEQFTEMDEKAMAYNFDINGEDVEKFVYYGPRTNITTSEFLILQVKSQDDVSALKEKIDKRAETLYKDFESYVPEEADKVEKRYYKVVGDVMIHVIAHDVDRIEDAF